MTTIRYFIPEDGDDESFPNVFLAPKARQSGMPPTLGQVKSAFPLPGKYHFRFKAALGGSDKVAVWMDVVEDRQPIPVYQNGVVAKVTRVGVEDDDDDDDDSDFGTSARQRAPPAAAAPPRPAPVPPPEPMFDMFDSTPSRPAAAATHSAPTSQNLFDAPPPASSAPSLLNMDHAPTPAATSSYLHAHSHAPAHNDFLGMTSTPPPTSYGQQQQQQQQQFPSQHQTPYNHSSSGPNSGNNNAFNAFGNVQQGPFF